MISKHIVPVLNKIEAAGYTYCILGGGALPDNLPGSDIDILIDRIDDKVEEFFVSLGFVKSKGVQVFKGRPVVFCYYDANDGWVPVHVIDPTVGGGKLIVPSDFSGFILRRAGMAFAVDELYFCATLMQSRRKRDITDKRKKRLEDKWYSPGIDRSACLELLESIGGDGISVSKKLRHSEPIDIDSIVNEGVSKSRSLFFVKLGRYAVRRLRRKPRVKPGLVVSVEGVDGSGKSTFIDSLNQTIPKEGRRLFHKKSMAGRGLGKWSRKFRSIWRKSCDRKGWVNGALKLGLLPFVFVIEMISFYCLYYSARFLAARGYNVIFDRYACLHYVRQLVHNESEFPGKATYVRALYYFAIKRFPSPDVFVYLSLNPSVAFSRKQEDSLGALQLKSDLYNGKILPLFKEKTEVFVLDAERPTDDVVGVFLEKYWSRLV